MFLIYSQQEFHNAALYQLLSTEDLQQSSWWENGSRCGVKHWFHKVELVLYFWAHKRRQQACKSQHAAIISLLTRSKCKIPLRLHKRCQFPGRHGGWPAYYMGLFIFTINTTTAELAATTQTEGCRRLVETGLLYYRVWKKRKDFNISPAT